MTGKEAIKNLLEEKRFYKELCKKETQAGVARRRQWNRIKKFVAIFPKEERLLYQEKLNTIIYGKEIKKG